MATIKQHGAKSQFQKWREYAFEQLENTPLSNDEMSAAIARLKKGAAHYPPSSADLIQVLAQYERDVAELKLRP